ncbi:unnamed protein product, partial [Prorocentrum cordatum]
WGNIVFLGQDGVSTTAHSIKQWLQKLDAEQRNGACFDLLMAGIQALCTPSDNVEVLKKVLSHVRGHVDKLDHPCQSHVQFFIQVVNIDEVAHDEVEAVYFRALAIANGQEDNCFHKLLHLLNTGIEVVRRAAAAHISVKHDATYGSDLEQLAQLEGQLAPPAMKIDHADLGSDDCPQYSPEVTARLLQCYNLLQPMKSKASKQYLAKHDAEIKNLDNLLYTAYENIFAAIEYKWTGLVRTAVRALAKVSQKGGPADAISDEDAALVSSAWDNLDKRVLPQPNSIELSIVLDDAGKATLTDWILERREFASTVQIGLGHMLSKDIDFTEPGLLQLASHICSPSEVADPEVAGPVLSTLVDNVCFVRSALALIRKRYLHQADALIRNDTAGLLGEWSQRVAVYMHAVVVDKADAETKGKLFELMMARLNELRDDVGRDAFYKMTNETVEDYIEKTDALNEAMVHLVRCDSCNDMFVGDGVEVTYYSNKARGWDVPQQVVRATATSLSVGAILLGNLLDLLWTIDPAPLGFAEAAMAPIDAAAAKAPTGRSMDELKPLIATIGKNLEMLKLAKDNLGLLVERSDARVVPAPWVPALAELKEHVERRLEQRWRTHELFVLGILGDASASFHGSLAKMAADAASPGTSMPLDIE